MAQYTYYEGDSNDIVIKIAGTRFTGLCGVGVSSSGNENEGAVRFRSVTVAQGKTLTSAKLRLKIDEKGTNNVKLRITGIDEDNVSDFTDNPFVKNQTSASTNFDASITSIGNFQEFDITSQAQEIINRSGWSSGNSMGFHLWNNGSDTGHWFGNSTGEDQLVITYDEPSPSRSISKSPSSSQSPSSSFSSSVSPSQPQQVSIRCALSGYDALNDSDINHYSLYSDEDNVLIKRKSTGELTLNSGSPTSTAISHDLGYIPFFTVYRKVSSGVWSMLNNQYNPFSVPESVCASTTTGIDIENWSANSSNYAYDIFYDDMSMTGSPSIVESRSVFKVARPHMNVETTTNPNNFIMHSDLNNFKILKEGNTTVTIPTSNGYVSFPHNTNVKEPFKFFCFLKMPDGKTLLTGNAYQNSYDNSVTRIYSEMDSTNITVYASYGSNINVDVYYLIYGTGKDNTLVAVNPQIAIAREGVDASTATNPDDYNFHSGYSTLKYFKSGSHGMPSVTTTTTKTIAHNLGYTPFFIGFCNDIEGTLLSTDHYAIMPYYLGLSTIVSPNRNIGSFIYADDTNIYLRAWYDSNATGSRDFIFYYKLFKNNLNL